METELGTLTRRRKHEEPGRVPARPLLALAKLRAGLALFARAANADDELDGDAITFDKPALLADPARLPIVAGASAMLDVWAGQDGLSSVALDGRGISWLHVEGGKVEHRRFRRTSQLRAVLRAGDQPMIVWATSRARCEQDENKCLRRATGLARLDESAEQLPSPIWLGGHPAGRVDRSLQFLMDDRVDLLARADAFGALEVRRFKLERAAQAEAAPAREKSPAPADGATAAAASSQDDARPLAPLERFPVPAADTPLEALLLPGQPAAVVYATGTNSGIEVSLVRYENGAAKVMLGALGGSGAFIASCAVDDERFVVYGTQSELAIARIGADGEPNAVLPAASIALGDPLHPEDPGHDRLRLLCRSGRALLVATTRERSLFTLGCDRERCERGPELARDVSGFDASAFGETTLIAYARSAQPQLVVLRLDAHGAPLEAGQTPAACWDPHGGMCGQPKLASDGSRLLLCAREDSDLLALESEDGGRVWKTLSGLKVSTAINTDVNAAMEQHRKRKGLE
jgi:hypothetical protein